MLLGTLQLKAISIKIKIKTTGLNYSKYKNEHANNEALQGEIDVLEKAYAESCKKNQALVHS